VGELAADYQFDPWLLSPETDLVANVTFETDKGRGRVAAVVKTMLDGIARKYAEYGIPGPPHVFIKNDAGTYGMGIMVVSTPDEIIGMNRKERNKMAVGKGRAPVRAVVVQEAVPTRTTTADAVAEPVIYLFGTDVIGAFLRANAERGAVDNLNAKGMTFYRYCDLHPARRPTECVCTDTRQAFYQVIAKLAAVAAAREHAAVCGNPADT
jgi:glutamate--cysteine ligase